MPAELKELFGEEVLDHTLVLLTCGDYLMGVKAEVLLVLIESRKVFEANIYPSCHMLVYPGTVKLCFNCL